MEIQFVDKINKTYFLSTKFFRFMMQILKEKKKKKKKKHLDSTKSSCSIVIALLIIEQKKQNQPSFIPSHTILSPCFIQETHENKTSWISSFLTMKDGKV